MKAKDKVIALENALEINKAGYDEIAGALAEIKAYCAIDSNNGYAGTFYCGMQLAKHQIDLILKRYGL